MNRVQALYQLQMIETAIDAAKKRVADIEEALQNDEKVLRCRADLKTCEDHLHNAQATVKDLELEIASIDAKIKEVEALLYSGTVKNPKELQERQEEVESLKRRRVTRENDLLGSMENLEQARLAHQTAQKLLQETEHTQNAANRSLYEEREKLNHQMGDKLSERKNMLVLVDPEMHKTYKKIKASKGGVAVCRLEEETCTGCRVEQNQTIVHQVKQAKTLVRCQNCGRILVDI